MGTTLTRNKELPMFFGQLQLKGERLNIDVDKSEDNPVVFYKHPNGSLYKGNSIEWLKSLKNESVDLIFADPPYNIKKADWDNFESQEEYIKWSMLWIEQASRILKPTVLFIFVAFLKY